METTYLKSELGTGKCKSCDELSDEILIGDGRCVDCIEEQKFFNETMNNGKEIGGLYGDDVDDIFGDW